MQMHWLFYIKNMLLQLYNSYLAGFTCAKLTQLPHHQSRQLTYALIKINLVTLPIKHI